MAIKVRWQVAGRSILMQNESILQRRSPIDQMISNFVKPNWSFLVGGVRGCWRSLIENNKLLHGIAPYILIRYLLLTLNTRNDFIFQDDHAHRSASPRIEVNGDLIQAASSYRREKSSLGSGDRIRRIQSLSTVQGFLSSSRACTDKWNRTLHAGPRPPQTQGGPYQTLSLDRRD